MYHKFYALISGGYFRVEIFDTFSTRLLFWNIEESRHVDWGDQMGFVCICMDLCVCVCL